MTDVTTPRYLEYVPLGDLRPHPDNPKAHALEDLAAAVGRFDFTEPFLLDERTGLLAAGHGRREVLLQLADAAEDAPPGIVVADGTGEWLVPLVRGWSSRNDLEAKAYLITSNRVPEIGGWDRDVLAPILQELQQDSGLGLEGVAFTTGQLDDLLASLCPPDFQPTDPDDQPRLDRKFHLVCNQCGNAIDPASAQRVDQ